MKKKYNGPEWEKLLFVSNDVMTQSGGTPVETKVSDGDDVVIHY